MKLIVQPDAGIAPIVTAIKQARKSIDILIFRLDRFEIAHALEAAVARGVRVRALTAHTNRGGTKSLRKLEMALLEGGVTVSRTADDLVRYHGKMMIVDDKFLHVYGFNFTGLDIHKSRSFGVISKNKKLLNEANRLFTADFDRLAYSSGYERFVVSPDNARDRLARFIEGARKELLIYDPQATDDAMLRLLTERVKAGVDVRIMGSQSLRRLELEKRREVGVIITDELVVRQMLDVFEKDWALTPSGRKKRKKEEKAEKAEKREKLKRAS